MSFVVKGKLNILSNICKRKIDIVPKRVWRNFQEITTFLYNPIEMRKRSSKFPGRQTLCSYYSTTWGFENKLQKARYDSCNPIWLIWATYGSSPPWWNRRFRQWIKPINIAPAALLLQFDTADLRSRFEFSHIENIVSFLINFQLANIK